MPVETDIGLSLGLCGKRMARFRDAGNPNKLSVTDPMVKRHKGERTVESTSWTLVM